MKGVAARGQGVLVWGRWILVIQAAQKGNRRYKAEEDREGFEIQSTVICSSWKQLAL